MNAQYTCIALLPTTPCLISRRISTAESAADRVYILVKFIYHRCRFGVLVAEIFVVVVMCVIGIKHLHCSPSGKFFRTSLKEETVGQERVKYNQSRTNQENMCTRTQLEDFDVSHFFLFLLSAPKTFCSPSRCTRQRCARQP